MKAKFIQIGNQYEMRLEDKTIYTSNKGETSKAFTKRVKEAAALDQGDLEIEELKADSFSKLTVEQLTKAKAKETGLLAELLQTVIDEKSGADEKAAAAEKAKLEKEAAAAKVKAEREEAAQKKADEKAAKAKEREEAKANKPTLEQVLAAAAEAKANVGKIVKFCPHRTAMKSEGVVNGVWVDKRVPMALYRIFDEAGVMYNKIIDAPDLEFGEMAPNSKAEAAEKKKAEKEEAAKLKAENAEKVAAEKEAAKIKKAEDAEKAKTEKAEAAEKAKTEKAEAAQKAKEEKEAAAAKKLADKEAKAKELAEAKAYVPESARGVQEAAQGKVDANATNKAK